ncbi:MAG: aldehyde dehydrogenase [Catenulispora sp. 13_1_20CM_3_70_7]|nr:MAG: aldehyde dehydrogenase [Catenulispora sp. 13_1_20CM_3_70_7]
MEPITEPAPYEAFERLPIGGRLRVGGSGHVLTDLDPWSGANVAEIPEAGMTDVADAYAAAGQAQRSWARAVPEQRAAVMRAAADIVVARHDELLGWLVRESGGTVAKCEIELGVVRAGFLEAAGMPHHAEGRIVPSDIPGKENRVYRRPVGVVCLISPWDFPMYLTNRTLAPALALGNAVVLKPSSQTPVTGGLLLARILEEAGLPAGVLNVVVGRSSEIGDVLVSHPLPRVVSFTGSTETGIAISRKAGIKRLLLELGGNAPMVVLDDADLDYAVESAVFGSFYNSGQICMIANRVIVDRSLHDDFVHRFVERAGTLGVGDPADTATFIGPVISRRQLDSVRSKVEQAVAQGAGLVLGGEPFGPAGLTLPPQVLVGTNDVATARQEVFGPAITIIEARDEADALRLANDTEYGLSSAVHTRDRERGTQFALRLEAGMTHVNDSPVNEEALDEFTTHHWVSVQHSPRVYPMCSSASGTSGR